MSKYILDRIVHTILSMFLSVSIIFIVLRLLPSDPAEALLGLDISMEAAERLREQMGLHLPIWQQYSSYIFGLVRGDLGISLSTGMQISFLIMQVLPYTIIYLLCGLAIGIIIGIPAGIVSAMNQNHWIDSFIRILTLGGISFPSFVIAIFLILIFAVYTRGFPVLSAGSRTNIIDMLYHGFLPSLTLGLGLGAYFTRISRSSVLEVLKKDYIRTAYAKGLRKSTVVYKHALRNAMIPIVTFIGFYAISIVGESVAVEIAFARPGIGRLVLNGVIQRDYPLIQSIIVLYVAFSAFVSLSVDIIYILLNPRIKYD
jgi:ABC-type dipeptide/oligopeptide/nickel transport system permease component